MQKKLVVRKPDVDNLGRLTLLSYFNLPCLVANSGQEGCNLQSESTKSPKIKHWTIHLFYNLQFFWLCAQISSKYLEETATCNLLNAVGVHVEQHAAVDDAATQLKQTVERQGGNIRFAPAFPSVLHVFLEFQPPEGTWQRWDQGRSLANKWPRCFMACMTSLPGARWRKHWPGCFLPLCIFAVLDADLIKLGKQLVGHVLGVLFCAQNELHSLGWRVWWGGK